MQRFSTFSPDGAIRSVQATPELSATYPHEVGLPGRYLFPFECQNAGLEPEIKDWLDDLAPDGWVFVGFCPRVMGIGPPRYWIRFADADAAFAFKMRWG